MPPGIPSMCVSPIIPITVSSKGVKSHGGGFPQFSFKSLRYFAAFSFGSDIFYLLHRHFCMCSRIARIHFGTYGFPDAFLTSWCYRGKFREKNVFYFSQLLSDLEKSGLRFLVPDGMTLSFAAIDICIYW